MRRISIIKCAATVYICGFLGIFIIMEISPTQEYLRWQEELRKAKQLRFIDGFQYPMDIDMEALAHKHLSGERNIVSIINPHPFIYLHNPKFLCLNKFKQRKQRRLRLMILVKSAVQYHQLRIVIRNTWGKRLREDTQNIQYAFLLGHMPDIQRIVDIEQQIYNDIIQENFDDTYRNNTYKTIMGFNWIVEYCNHAEFVLFLDDDMYLNMNMLIEYMNVLEASNTRNILTGILSHDSAPLRNTGSRHFVSLNEYPYDVYPDFLAGSFILASIYVVKLFQSIFPYVKHLPIDDSYLGIVAKKLNIMPTENIMVVNQFSAGIGNISHLIALHGFRDHELYLSTYNKMS